MCYQELDVPNSLKMCLRILLNINTNKTQDEIKHIYLKGASILRGDLKNE
jgi:chorismate mutase